MQESFAPIFGKFQKIQWTKKVFRSFGEVFEELRQNTRCQQLHPHFLLQIDFFGARCWVPPSDGHKFRFFAKKFRRFLRIITLHYLQLLSWSRPITAFKGPCKAVFKGHAAGQASTRTLASHTAFDVIGMIGSDHPNGRRFFSKDLCHWIEMTPIDGGWLPHWDDALVCSYTYVSK